MIVKNDQGFFGVYARVFEALIAEEMPHLADSSDADNIPRFGLSNDNYEEVGGKI